MNEDEVQTSETSTPVETPATPESTPEPDQEFVE